MTLAGKAFLYFPKFLVFKIIMGIKLKKEIEVRLEKTTLHALYRIIILCDQYRLSLPRHD
jgi:hypothetical protein